MNIPSNLRSFVLVCQELGISNIDHFAQIQVRGTSIEEWANYSVEEFIERTKFLSESERESLVSHMSKCADTLHLPKIAGGLHWKD